MPPLLPAKLFRGRRICTLLPTHRPPFSQASHDKPLVSSGLVAFGLAAIGSVVAIGLVAFGLILQDWWVFSLVMLVDCFRFGYGWFHVFATTGCVASGFAVTGLAAVGFKALGLATVSLAVVRSMQHLVHCSDAA